jgi:hypothetical protein
MVENLFDGELLEKEKILVVSFLLITQAHLWSTCVKTNKEDVDKGHVKTWPKFKELFLEFFYHVTYDFVSWKDCGVSTSSQSFFRWTRL